MKVYNILATIVVEDKINNEEIKYLITKFEEEIMDVGHATNQIFHYELKESIDYPDCPESDETGEFYDKWLAKSQEVIDKILIEMRNP